jgi:IS30 family transposase
MGASNGLLRQYFPEGTDLSRYDPEQLAAVAHTPNIRPRKVLDWKTPLKRCAMCYISATELVLRRPFESTQ